MNSKDLFIAGHERSGNHMAINAFAFCLTLPFIQKDIPLKTNPERIREFFDAQNNPTGMIYKSHHEVFCLQHVWEKIQKNYNILYIVRDGRDVMTSCLYYFNQYHERGFFKSDTVGDLIRENPNKYSFHKCYWRTYVPTMADRWAHHIWWWTQKEDVVVIRYEDMVYDFQNTIIKAFDKLGLKITGALRKPELKDRCVYPRKGIVGDWKNHFTEEDNEFFWHKAGHVMRQFNYEKH